MASLNKSICVLQTQIPTFEKKATIYNSNEIQILEKEISNLVSELLKKIDTLQNQKADLEKSIQAKEERPYIIMQIYRLLEKLLILLSIKERSDEESSLLIEKTLLTLDNEISKLRQLPCTPKPQPIKETLLLKLEPEKKLSLTNESSKSEQPPCTPKLQPIKDAPLLMPEKKLSLTNESSKPKQLPCTLALGLKGFENRGNACFMNAVKQVVFNDSLLCNVIKKELLKYSSTNEKEQQSVKIFLKELDDYHNETVKTIPFNDSLRYLLSNTKAGEQEDAGEFLLTLLDKISRTAQPNLLLTKKSFSRWEVVRGLSQENKDDFGTMPSDNIKKSVEVGAHPYITVPMPLTKSCLIYGKDLIKKMFEWTGVGESGQEAKFQQNGNLYLFKTTEEKTEISQAPILVFQLNRFSPGGKINTPITMPEKLTINDKSYELKSFIQHIGDSVDSGHYISYIKKGSVWCKADDATITPIQEKSSLNMARDEGYIYTYHLVP